MFFCCGARIKRGCRSASGRRTGSGQSGDRPAAGRYGSTPTCPFSASAGFIPLSRSASLSNAPPARAGPVSGIGAGAGRAVWGGHRACPCVGTCPGFSLRCSPRGSCLSRPSLSRLALALATLLSALFLTLAGAARAPVPAVRGRCAMRAFGQGPRPVAGGSPRCPATGGRLSASSPIETLERKVKAGRRTLRSLGCAAPAFARASKAARRILLGQIDPDRLATGEPVSGGQTALGPGPPRPAPAAWLR